MRKPWIEWTDKEKELLKKKYPTASWKKLMELFEKRHSREAIRSMAQSIGLKKSKLNRENSWSSEEEEFLKKAYPDIKVSWEEIEKKISRHSRAGIELRAIKVLKLERPRVEPKPEPEPEKVPEEITDLQDKKWPEMKVFAVDPKKWREADPRAGFMSGVDFKDSGFRAGLLESAFEIFAFEACRYIGLIGRLVSKNWVQEQLKTVSLKHRKEFLAALIENSAQGLAATLPRIKKSNTEYVRIYIVTSPPYDGEVGELIAKRLQELRPEDIRVYNPVSDRLLIPEAGDNKNIGLICPEVSRLPSEYFSSVVEREVKDKEGQTRHDYPYMWVVGTASSSIHIPRRPHKPPVISLPSLKVLQKVRVGENQVGIRVVKYVRNSDEYFVRTYSLKDLTKKERDFITGIKEGSQEIHRRIVEILKAEGARNEGVIAERLKMESERDKVHQALEFLTEDKMSPLKTWPALFYDVPGQRYDFHPDWIQERLRYPSLIKAPYVDERMLFFSCLHAGYNTTDYEYIVKVLPEIVIKNQIRYLCCLGDVVAGLKHNFLEQGEVMGGMNYTEQEQFAAELIGTVFMKVFEHGLMNLDKDKIKNLTVKDFVDKLLPVLAYISGNHDEWQEALGVSPLKTFRGKLTELLCFRIELELKKLGLNPGWGELWKAVTEKLVRLSIDADDYNPVLHLPSGVSVELHHPHMGRSKTKSLRAQEMLDTTDSQVVGQGNFHTAIVTDKWEPYVGQRSNVEAGTFVIFTRHERRTGNKKVNFGPVYYRALSRDKRIFMTESAFFNKPLLEKPRPKWTDWQKLKDELGVYRTPS